MEPVLQQGIAELDGEVFNTGINGADVDVLGNSILRARSAFAFNSGRNWYKMKNDDLVEQQNFAHAIGDSVFVLNVNAMQWYSVDTSARLYTPSDLDPSYCRYALLPMGAGLAIKHVEGDEIDLMYRSSATDAWQPVGILSTPEGSELQPKRSVYLNSDRMFVTGTGKAIFFLDSARVLEYNGTTVIIRTLTPTPVPGTILNDVDRVRGANIVRTTYVQRAGSTTIGHTTIDYSLDSEEISVYETGTDRIVDLTDTGYLGTSGFFREWKSGISRPVLGAVNDLGMPIAQPYLQQMLMAGGLPTCADLDGNIYVVDKADALPAVIPGVVISRQQQVLSNRLLQRVRVAESSAGAMAVPTSVGVNAVTLGETPRRIARSASTLGAVTCASQLSDGRFLIGGDSLARQRDTTFEVLPLPSSIRDTQVTISSIATKGTDTIAIAFRGFGVGSEQENNFTFKRGGIAYTTDAGVSWSKAELPGDEQWVETLTRGPDNAWYCWATVMVFDSSLSGRANPTPRYGTARLYRAEQLSGPWTAIFSN